MSRYILSAEVESTLSPSEFVTSLNQYGQINHCDWRRDSRYGLTKVTYKFDLEIDDPEEFFDNRTDMQHFKSFKLARVQVPEEKEES